MKNPDGTYGYSEPGAKPEVINEDKYSIEFIDLDLEQFIKVGKFAEEMLEQDIKNAIDEELKEYNDNIVARKKSQDERERERRICVKVKKQTCPKCGEEIIVQKNQD